MIFDYREMLSLIIDTLNYFDFSPKYKESITREIKDEKSTKVCVVNFIHYYQLIRQL